MNNSLFIQVINALSEHEFRDFERFVNSPYFNTSRATTALFNIIKEHYPVFDNIPAKKNIYEIIHPGGKYNDVLMRKYISNLNKLAEKFLTINNNRFAEHSFLTGLLNKRLYTLFLKRMARARKNISHDIVNDDHFTNTSLITGELMNYYSTTSREFEYEKEKTNILETDAMYFFYRLAQVNYRRQSLASDKDYKVTDYIMNGIDIKKLYESIETSEVKNKPVLKFLLSLPLLRQTRDEKLYREIKQFSFSYVSGHDAKTIFLGFLYLLDFISYKIEQGCQEYYRERYLVYKYEEEVRGLSTTRDKMSFSIFRNYFNSALRNDDIEWAEYLVDKYIGEFEPKGEAKLKNYFTSFILFYRKQYKKALASIADFNFNEQGAGDYPFTRDMRTLFLQLYYELGYFDEAFYSIDAFYHYLKTNRKINQKNRLYFGNFIKHYKKLITIAAKENYNALQKLKKNVLSDKAIKKVWLLEKISELESKVKI